MRTFVTILALAVVAMLVPAGCDASPPAPSGITFTGQVAPLPGFSYDTGLQPPSSQAQVELTVSTKGAVTVTAQAAIQGSALVPTPATGNVSLDLHFLLAGRLKVTSTFKSYDGPIPNMDNIDIAATGQTTFDPFLIGGGTATVTAPVAPTDLPPIPLGSVPGTLTISIEPGSTITTAYQGTCMTIAGGSASYQGELTTSGTLVLKGTLALSLPSPLDKSITLPDVTVNVPPTTVGVDLGTQPVPGVADSNVGPCTTIPDGGVVADASDDSPSASDAPSEGSTGDGGCLGAGGACTNAETGNCCTDTCDKTTQQCIARGAIAITVPSGANPTFVDEIAANGSNPLNLTYYFTAPGLGPNTHVILALSGGTGCSATQYVLYKPDDGTGSLYSDNGTSSCGLDVTSLPPGHATGSFTGTLKDASNKTVQLTFSFDAYPP